MTQVKLTTNTTSIRRHRCWFFRAFVSMLGIAVLAGIFSSCGGDRHESVQKFIENYTIRNFRHLKQTNMLGYGIFYVVEGDSVLHAPELMQWLRVVKVDWASGFAETDSWNPDTIVVHLPNLSDPSKDNSAESVQARIARQVDSKQMAPIPRNVMGLEVWLETIYNDDDACAVLIGFRPIMAIPQSKS